MTPINMNAAPSLRPNLSRRAVTLSGSAIWHVAMALGAIAIPSAWPWWLLGVIVNHGVLTGAGLLPRCDWLGPNLRRLPDAAVARRMIAITIDDGPNPLITPQVLDLLDRAGAKATFFCIGTALQAHPALGREIIARGHAIENHTQRHSHQFAFLWPTSFRREIGSAQRTIAQFVGHQPQFFRAPAGLRNPLLQPVLNELSLTLTSWTRRGFDTVTADPDRVFARLDRGLAAGDILLLHDGNAAQTSSGQAVILQVLPRLLAHCAALGLTCVTLEQGFAVAAPNHNLDSNSAR
jgi:peptidoglycan-N-acetylglucosamine deacetylase